MYAFRTTHGPAELAFTDRYGGVSAFPFEELNLALDSDDRVGSRAENHRIVLDDFGPGDELRDLRQVHGGEVDVVEDPVLAVGERPEADALVSSSAGLTLMVRAADCVPVLLVDAGAGVIGAAHCGRAGLVARVVPHVVERMRERGAGSDPGSIAAWIGPHVCGRCYEVPQEMQAAVVSVVPQSSAQTSWGTPSVDLGGGVRAQLEAAGVEVHDVSRCTRESVDLYSHRRDGARSGRLAGLVRLRTSAGAAAQ